MEASGDGEEASIALRPTHPVKWIPLDKRDQINNWLFGAQVDFFDAGEACVCAFVPETLDTFGIEW